MRATRASRARRATRANRAGSATEATPAARTAPAIGSSSAATAIPAVVTAYEELLQPFRGRGPNGYKDLTDKPGFDALSPADKVISQFTACQSGDQYLEYKAKFFAKYNQMKATEEPDKDLHWWTKWGERKIGGPDSPTGIGHPRPDKIQRTISCWMKVGHLPALDIQERPRSGRTSDDERDGTGDMGGDEQGDEIDTEDNGEERVDEEGSSNLSESDEDGDNFSESEKEGDEDYLPESNGELPQHDDKEDDEYEVLERPYKRRRLWPGL
ncbi:hypothetical protein BDV97DRAFT_176220 [Delphinella strobiligena]|nr:hypothetical protein BDV97DRAFT_176220 [Delphinella strobiligena]